LPSPKQDARGRGEIDIAGKSLGRYQPKEKLAKKRELMGEIISFFDL